MEKNKNNSGQLLLESAIAITVLIVGLLGIFGLLARSFGLNKVITSRYTAAYLAAEGIEIVKNLVDSNAVVGKSGSAWNDGLLEGFYELVYDSQSLEESKNRYLCFDSQNHIFDYSCYQPSPPPTNQKTLFRRIVEIANVFDANGNLNQIQVNSKVFWKDDLLIDAEDHFFNILGQ